MAYKSGTPKEKKMKTEQIKAILENFLSGNFSGEEKFYSRPSVDTDWNWEPSVSGNGDFIVDYKIFINSSSKQGIK